MIHPGQSVAQKLISVILPKSCWEVIFSPLIVIKLRFFTELVWRLKNKSIATKAIRNTDMILFFFNLNFYKMFNRFIITLNECFLMRGLV